MTHRKQHWVGKPPVSSNCGVSLVRRAFTLLLSVALSSAFVSVSNAALPSGSVGPTCVGDCDGGGAVTVDEIVKGVSIALGTQSLDQCPQFDCNGTGQVTIDCIINAVSAALNGCPSAPTSSPTRNIGTATPTATSTFTATRTTTPSLTSTPTPPSDHFVDNGDGTITDTQTDLIWEKKDQGGGLHDTNSRFPWAGICSDNGEFCQPDAAAATTCSTATGGSMGCAQCAGTATCHPIIGSTTIWDWLNQINAANFAGHSDWRIPSVGRDGGTVQLETIVDQSVSGCGSLPCVPPAFNTACVAGCTAAGCSCTQAERYWSATSIVGNLPFPSVWGVFFRTGDVTGIDEASAFFVRAVRGGAPTASQTATRAPTQTATSTPTDTPTPISTPSPTRSSTVTATLAATSTRPPTATNSPTTTPTTATAPCGTFLGKFGSQGSGDGQFVFPEAVGVDQNGNVFVADTEDHRIEKFTSTGTFLRQWGSMGGADGQFDSPEGVAVDGAGSVYVVDANNRVQKFDNNGTFLTSWGDAGSGDGQLSSPAAVAVDGNGNVFVADRFNNRIQKFTNGGTFLTKWGSVGNGDGQFSIPDGVAVDGDGNVFVADQFNHRIQKFTSTGTFLAKWGRLGLGDGEFSDLEGVAVNGDGDVFVADVDRIQKFTNDGIFVTQWGSLGNADGQFNSALCVAVDGEGNVFVCDGNHRVQKFACP